MLQVNIEFNTTLRRCIVVRITLRTLHTFAHAPLKKTLQPYLQCQRKRLDRARLRNFESLGFQHEMF